jgi:hypothetical protein
LPLGGLSSLVGSLSLKLQNDYPEEVSESDFLGLGRVKGAKKEVLLNLFIAQENTLVTLRAIVDLYYEALPAQGTEQYNEIQRFLMRKYLAFDDGKQIWKNEYMGKSRAKADGISSLLEEMETKGYIERFNKEGKTPTRGKPTAKVKLTRGGYAMGFLLRKHTNTF